MSLDYYAASIYGGTKHVLYLAHRGAVEGALEAGFVNVPAAYFSELLRV